MSYGRPRIIAALSVLVVATLPAHCSRLVSEREHAGASHPWTLPGVLRIASVSEPANLNPALTADIATLNISMFIYSWAIRFDGNAKPVPDALREVPTVGNGDVSKDGLTLKYKLRPNITWQDGLPLTCNDLKFTWRVVMNPHNNVVVTDGYRDIGSINCSDSHVVVIHMKRVYAPYLQQLWSVNGNAPILPEHLLARYNDAKGSFNTNPYNSLPIGSGPFKVVAWERGQEVRLVANPNFYLGRPKLDEVVFKVLPDEDTAAQELQTHEIDLLAGSARTWPLDAAVAAEPRNGVVAKTGDSFAFARLDFNLTRPIVGDRNVRIALAYATDRAAIVKKLLHGLGVLAETDQHPRLSWAHTNDVTHYRYDPQHARAILDADGWKLSSDGVRVKRGRRFEFSLSNPSGSSRPTAGEIFLQREWREVGAKVAIENYPSGRFAESSAAGIVEGGHYDVADYTWYNAADPDDSSYFSADNLAPHGQNTTRWTNLRATTAINDALRTVDRARRRRDYTIVQNQLTRDLPTIILYFLRVPYVYNSDLKGFDPSSVVSAYWDPWNYSI